MVLLPAANLISAIQRIGAVVLKPGWLVASAAATVSAGWLVPAVFKQRCWN